VTLLTSAAEDTAALRKARGAFFTPPALCDYVSRWAVRTASDRVLEPSCGEAAFLLAAGERLAELGCPPDEAQLDGVELHEASAAAADLALRERGYRPAVTAQNFFSVAPQRRYQVVVGNPPYIRYQDFAGDSRILAREAALRGGVPLTGLASAWAAFTVHAAEFLAPGGRMGLVLPAELLTVNYAAGVRRHLLESFGRVRLVLFTERVFPGVLEEVVLLLAEDAQAEGGTDQCELHQVRSAADLIDGDEAGAAPSNWTPADSGAKWTPALLSADALKAYDATLRVAPGFTNLQTWGETTLGMVTGNNRYFALSPARATELGLPSTELLPLSPPGSRHLRGLKFTKSAWDELGASGAGTLLFRPGPDPAAMSSAARGYLALGEELGVPRAYKCRVRQHWWQVPLVAPADLLLTYMNADTPRLTAVASNLAIRHLNSVHGVYLRRGLRSLGKELLPLAALNTMTLLGAETVGRAYGGGMLKLEPREADRLPIPSPELVEAARPALAALRPQMATALRNGRLSEAAKLVDEVLLIGQLGLSRAQVRTLEQAHQAMTARRVARGGHVRQPAQRVPARR